MSCWVFWVCLCLVMSNNLSYHMSTIGVPYCDFRYVFRITRCSFRLYLQLGVGGLMSWCTTPIDYMSNMAGLLWATGAACSSQVSPQIFGGSELLVFFGFICYVFCSVCHRPVFCAPNVANFSGGSVLIAPSVFSGIYSYIWHQSQYIDRCKFIQK